MIPVSAKEKEQFEMAVKWNNDSPENVLKTLMRQYTANALEWVAQNLMNPPADTPLSLTTAKAATPEIRLDTPVNAAVSTANNPYAGKANRKIPKWSGAKEMYPHRIIAAYWKAAELSGGEVLLDTMERLCKNQKEHPDLFIPGFRFKDNYAQMKADRPSSYGKVFEDDYKRVWIWEGVAETMEKYKDKFIH